MAKIYKISSRGKTWEQVANNAAEIKQLVAAKFGMKKMPKGTQVVKIGLTKGKADSSPVKAQKTPVRGAVVRVESKMERSQKSQKRKEMAGTVLKGPDGATYTIGQRGRVPLWVREKLGEATQEATQESTQEVRELTDTKSRLLVNHWQVANKMITISGMSFAIEENGKVRCEYTSEDCEVQLAKGTKYSILGEFK